ncbi:hypothetical protein KR093_010971, partial [Drosophila rubida]
LCILCWQMTATLATNCCQEGDTQENPVDCSQYYVCCNGAYVAQSCPAGNYWNAVAAQCEQNNGECCPGSCTGNELKVDPQNCAAYYQCVGGQIVNQKCPSKTYFNTSLKACVVDSDAAADDCCQPGDVKVDPDDCTKYFVCCTGKFKPMSCPSGEYWNVEAGICEIDNGQCNCNGQQCTEGDIITDASNCANFKICVNGKYESVPCPSGEYWNSVAKQCQLDEGQCNGTPAPPECVEGDVKEHVSNCAGFFNCTNGKWTAQLCGAGKYWNVQAKECQKDEGQCNGTPAPECVDGDVKENPANCAGYYNCSNGHYVAQLCGAGLYWNVNAKKCVVDNGECNGTPPPICVDGEVIANPSNCAGYYICTNGKYVAQLCGSGLYWNANAKQCQKDDGQCNGTPAPECVDGDVKENPANCAGYYNCTNGQYVAQLCGSGLYWNANAKQCQKDDGQCNGTPAPECVDGDVKENPANCAGYYNCTNGKYVAQLCGSGLYWNANAKQCQKDDGQCNGTPAPECVDGDVKENPANCAGYYNCTNGQYVAQLCGSGLYWNANAKQCQKDDGQCNGTPAPPTCVEDNIKENPSNCAGYMQCINNVWVPRPCSAGSFFNKTLQMCVVDSEGICIPKVCEDECCDYPNNWMGPVDRNCSAFIQCVNGRKIQQTCGKNLQFNNATKECDYPENVQCDDGSPPPSGPTAGPSGTYCASKGRCVGLPEGAKMANQPTCSTTYIVCQCECEIEMICPAGLMFNDVFKACDWPANIGC